MTRLPKSYRGQTDIATDALVRATEALTKIEEHQKQCATRWAWVLGLLAAVFALLVKVAVFPDLF